MSHRGRSMRSQRGSQQSQVPTTSRRALRESSSSSDEALDVSQETEIDLRRDEKKTYAVAASKYILNMSKNKVPIKCSEVVKHCMRGEIKLYPEIYAKASKQLADLYGLEAHETRDEKLGKIILCTSNASAASELELTQQQRIDMQLLFIVLSYIHMKGGSVAEGSLFGFLKRLDIAEEPHDRFGHFKKTITETYVRQLYLKREKTEIEGGNVDDRIQYSWGHRAQLEVSVDKVTEAVAKILQVPTTAISREQHQSDEENNEAIETSDIEMNDE